jgi:hypothetical protein
MGEMSQAWLCAGGGMCRALRYALAHAGAVLGVPIIAKYAQLLPLSARHLRNIGHEIVRDAVWILAYLSALVCSHWIEVAEQQNVPLAVALVNITHDLLKEELRPTVWVRRGEAAVLSDRQALRVSVDGRGGGKDEILDAVLLHGFHEDQRARDVVLVVGQRDAHRFADGLLARKVDHGCERVATELRRGRKGKQTGGPHTT